MINLTQPFIEITLALVILILQQLSANLPVCLRRLTKTVNNSLYIKACTAGNYRHPPMFMQSVYNRPYKPYIFTNTEWVSRPDNAKQVMRYACRSEEHTSEL